MLRAVQPYKMTRARNIVAGVRAGVVYKFTRQSYDCALRRAESAVASLASDAAK